MGAPAVTQLSVAIVGAGFSGIGIGIALRRAGIESFEIFEQAEILDYLRSTAASHGVEDHVVARTTSVQA